MSEISDTRDQLHAQLLLYTAGVLESERVHLYTPTIVASPCIWIAQPQTGTTIVGSPGAKVRTISFPIAIVADGGTPAQCALLDELVSRVSDAIYDMPRAEDEGAFPESLDIGGVNTRAVVHTVAVTSFAHSFCTTPPVPVP